LSDVSRALLLWLALGWAAAPAWAHQGTPNLGASRACEARSLGDACAWTDAHDARFVGSCRQVADGLLCVRSQPIVYPQAAGHGHAHTESIESLTPVGGAHAGTTTASLYSGAVAWGWLVFVALGGGALGLTVWTFRSPKSQ
jgi:hypothetical protein